MAPRGIARGSKVAASKVLAVAIFVLKARSVTSGTSSNASTTFNCSSENRNMTAVADASWQSVGIRRTSPGECTTGISLPASATSGLSSSPGLRQLLLLRIDEMQLLPPRSPCVYNDTSLLVYVVTPYRRTQYVCDTGASTAWYLWASEPVRLYLYVSGHSSANIDFAASYSVAFAVFPAINLCGSSNGSIALAVQHTAFAFASDARYAQIPPNNATCSQLNYTLTITAANASAGQLTVSVLSAPWNDSCWSLLYRGQRCNDSGTYYAPADQAVQLVYTQTDSENCSKQGTFDGFTVRAYVGIDITRVSAASSSGTPPGLDGNQTAAGTSPPSTRMRPWNATSASPGDNHLASATGSTAAAVPASSPDERVVAGASAATAAAAIGLLAGLTAAIVVRRRRLTAHQPLRQSKPSDGNGSQPHFRGDDVQTGYGLHHYPLPVESLSSGHPYNELVDPSRQHGAQATAPSEGPALLVEPEVQMVDNDLYGKAFGD